MGPSITCRLAEETDAGLLATMNQQLIRDERHRNAMTLPELEQRMRTWLRGEYRAVLIEADGQCVGHSLFRHEPDHVYLRQFYVAADHRRRGVGRAAMQWIREHAWQGRRVRLDVLVGNDRARAFWEAVGFVDYCVTMEMDGARCDVLREERGGKPRR